MKFIWLKEEENNTYAQFKAEFDCLKGDVNLYVSADYKYEAYVNGVLVSNCQYADLPTYKSVDSVNINAFLREGKNELLITAYHMGVDFSSCRPQKAGVAFRVECNGETVVESDENTFCRKAKGYRPGGIITAQLGYGWNYDCGDVGKAWETACLTNAENTLVPRPIPALSIGNSMPAVVCAQGIFAYREGNTAGEKAQNAWLSTLRFAEMTGKNRIAFADLHAPVTFKATGGDGVFVVVDLQKETSGYPTFSITVNKACKGIFVWGEHLADLRIRAEREGRNFASEYSFKQGENSFAGYIHRLGCRYLCLFVESDEVTINKLTLREATYPFKMPKKDFGDRLLNRIYEVGRRTMQICAHEHYEDCPWREQALYGMDARNQMLFGYGAFEEYTLPRAVLRLQVYSTREDGLLSLCAPSRAPICIPSFSLYWAIAVYENSCVDYDEAFVKEMLPYADKILENFEKHTTDVGVACFKEKPYWNFYEWSDGLDGGDIFRDYEIDETTDCILTVLSFMAARGIASLHGRVGNVAQAEKWAKYSQKVQATIEAFYDKEKGLYASFIKDGEKYGWHAHTQAIVLLADVPECRKEYLCEVLKNPDGKVVDMTFAALQFKYDAIMACQGDIDWCVDDICKLFGDMLFQGATSYWETALGEADFDDAGSLCHGWSAVGCYVFDKYLK